MTRAVNDATVAMVAEFEGLRLKAYRDAVGVWTIGYGHTAMAGPPVPKAGLIISEAHAREILARDLAAFAKGVAELIDVELNDNQFGALVSFAFNVGLGNFRKSSVRSYVNALRFAQVPARLLLWNRAGGKVLAGLTRRRKAEGGLFMRPVTP